MYIEIDKKILQKGGTFLMGLFDKKIEKPAENKPLFGGKNDGRNDGRNDEGNDGRNDGNKLADGGSGDAGKPDGGKPDGGKPDGGKPDGGTVGATFTFSAASGELGESDSGIEESDYDDGRDSELSTTIDTENVEENDAKRNTDTRPVWLNKKKEEKKEEPPKDIKIQRNNHRRGKNEGLLSEEQVKIIFSGVFDGIALIKGEHWKLDKSELEIIPALTRVLNRIVDALPKGVAKHTFNVMDYVVIISCVAAIVMKRVKADKKGDSNDGNIQQKESSRGTATATPLPLSDGGQGNSGSAGTPINGSGKPDKRVSDGFTGFAPITDLAQSIKPVW